MTMLETLMNQVNITILPVIILPVAGLTCLMLFNRLGSINNYLHTVQKELRQILTNSIQKTMNDQEKQLSEVLYQEQKVLASRSHTIRRAIKCCFIALAFFALSALTVIGSVFIPNLVYVTLLLWVIGALSYFIAVLNALCEIHHPALHSLHFETTLIEEWWQEYKR